jgi:hypothetical protein
MKDIFKNYRKYIENSRKQTKFLSTNYSYTKMGEVLKSYMDPIKVAVDIPIQLPKLNKVNI